MRRSEMYDLLWGFLMATHPTHLLIIGNGESGIGNGESGIGY
ncbi:hypothetical protein QUB00_22030 [Microcoleus sp. F8_C2]